MKLSISLMDQIEITHIESNFHSSVIGIGEKAIKHHYFKVTKIDNMKIEIHISPGFPQCVAYLSNRNAHLPIRE